MARLVHCGMRLPHRERGFAMIVIISLIALVTSYLIAHLLSRTNAELSNERERRSTDTLRQAKAALIAYAASEQWQLYKGQVTNQPGGLPCPDLDDDGDSQGLCSNALNRVGRLPWKTLGVDDLRDSSGERLWYAVSSNFRKLSGTTVINSDTQGLLTVTGTAPANNVVAIVFAPGAAIQGQNRDPADAAAHNAPASYLEGFTAGASDYTFTTNALPSDTLNDRLLVITQADLMSVVESAVAARIERDIKPYFQTYFNQWGAFPFPAAFANPSPGDNSNAPSSPPQPRTQSAYAGDPTQTSGLLPITASLTYPWTGGSGTVTLTGGIAGSISGVSCVTVVLPGWRCSFTLNALNSVVTCGLLTPYCMLNPSFAVTGGVGANAGKSLAKLPDVGAVTVTSGTGTPRVMSSTAINGTLTSAGVGTVNFQGTWSFSRYSASSFTRAMIVTIPDVAVSPLAGIAVSAATNASPISITTTTPHGFSTGAAVTISGVNGNAAANGSWTVTVTDSTHLTLDGSTGSGNYTSGGTMSPAATWWFTANEWYRQLYYAVSPGHLPGGGGACIPSGSPSCLTVSNLSPVTYPTPNDKRAILVFAGRTVNGSTRPSSSLNNYLEGENSTPADSIFEHRQGLPTSINDRVVVVAP